MHVMLVLPALPALCIVLHITVAPSTTESKLVHDDFTDHLQVLHAEFQQIVQDMEAQNAINAAAAHYHAQLICERFLATPSCLD